MISDISTLNIIIMLTIVFVYLLTSLLSIVNIYSFSSLQLPLNLPLPLRYFVFVSVFLSSSSSLLVYDFYAWNVDGIILCSTLDSAVFSILHYYASLLKMSCDCSSCTGHPSSTSKSMNWCSSFHRSILHACNLFLIWSPWSCLLSHSALVLFSLMS